MSRDTAMFVGFSCATCSAPIEAVLASIETEEVGVSWIAAESHERSTGHVPQQVRFRATPVGLPEGGE